MIKKPLETKRLIVRRIRMSDCNTIHSYMSRRDVVHFLPEKPLSLKEVETHQKEHLEQPLAYAVTLKDSGQMIGHVVFHEVFNCYTYEIGWLFHPDFQGCGYASEAALRVLDYGFKELNLHRIIGTCHTDNTRSWKLMKRLNMRKEAHFIEVIFRDGEWIDECLCAILSREYRSD